MVDTSVLLESPAGIASLEEVSDLMVGTRDLLVIGLSEGGPVRERLFTVWTGEKERVAGAT